MMRETFEKNLRREKIGTRKKGKKRKRKRMGRKKIEGVGRREIRRGKGVAEMLVRRLRGIYDVAPGGRWWYDLNRKFYHR